MDKPLTASAYNKVLAFGLAMTLVAWTFGVYMVLPAQAVDGHPNGTLVVSGSTVYKIMDNQRLGFPSANVFMSHGYAWSQVVPANSADLALAQGSNVMYAEGSLVNDAGTIFIISGGMKRGFTSGAVFTGLGYQFKNVVNDSLSSYTQGANVDSATAAHAAGTLVNSNGTIWKITSTGRSGIPSMAVFQSNGFGFAKVVPANSADLGLNAESNLGYRVGSIVNDGGTIYAVTSATGKQGFPSASCYTDFGFAWSAAIAGSTAGLTAGTILCNGGVVTPPATNSTGTLMVSLASDTPAAGVAIKAAARVPFTKVNLTASGGDVVVDSWVVKRTGVGQDSSISSVDIVDLSSNATINDTGKTFNTDHTANFTEDLTIKSGETKSVYLAANMASSPGSGEQLSLTLLSMTLKGGTLSASFPITGNAMTVNTSITIGTATVSRGAYSNATSTTIEVGKKAYTFNSFQIQAGSAEDVTFSQVKVYQQGSASLANDLANIKLFRDGTLLATGTVSGNYVNFSFAAQTLPKGQTGQYVVQADVVGGSARTVIMGIYRITDILVTGTTYGANITPSYTGAGSSYSSSTVYGTPVLMDNSFTISTGTLRVGRSNTVAATNITVGSNQTLGAFEFEAKGEPIVITQMVLRFATSTATAISTTALQGIKVVDSNGKTVAGPTDPTFAPVSGSYAYTVTLSDTFTVPTGIQVYKVLGTVATNGSWATNDTVTVSFQTPASGITSKGDSTGQSVSATPSSNITASQQTVKASSLTVTKNSQPTNKSSVANSTGVLVGSWTFDGTNSGEDVRITSLAIRASSSAVFTNLTLKDVQSAGGTVNKALSPVNSAITSKSAAATSTFALTEPVIVTKGTSKVIDLYADIPNNATTGEIDSYGCNGGCVTAYGATTGNSASITVVNNDGALITVASAGTLTLITDASAPSSRQVVFGSTGVALTDIRAKATNEAVDLTKVTVSVADGALTGTASGDYTQIAKIYLKKDGATIGSASGYTLGQASTVINFGRGEFTIPEGTTGVKLSVLGDLVNVGTNQVGTANADIKVGLGATDTAGFTAFGNQSNGSATVTNTSTTGSAVILHKSIPSVVFTAGSALNKLGASAVLHETKITAVGNDVGIYRMSYSMTSSTGILVSNYYLKLAACGNSCGGLADGTVLTATTAAGSWLINGEDVVTFTISNALTGKQYMGIASGGTATVDLFGTVSLTTNADTVTTRLLGDTATTSNDVTGQVAAGFTVHNQGNFVWSDLNGDSSQASSALTNKQWYNGYYVTGLGPTVTSTPVTIGE